MPTDRPEGDGTLTWDSMGRAVRNAGRSGLVALALSAVDVALWDLVARLHELPLARLWGGYTGWREISGLLAGLQTDLSGHCATYLTVPAAAVPPGCATSSGSTPGHGLTLRRAAFDARRVA